MNRSGKLHALLSTARVANIPSVVSNVWLGVAAGAAINLSDPDSDIVLIPWSAVCHLMLASICLYVAGNFLNDWMDRSWDAERRPERALPSGIFTPGLYLWVALLLAGTGLGLAGWGNPLSGVVALLIVVCIVIYTVWHKRGVWTVIPMGLCRGLLPVMGALGMINTPESSVMIFPTALLAGICGGSLFFYIVGLSLSARCESIESPPKFAQDGVILWFTLPAFLLLIPGLLTENLSGMYMISFIPYFTWFGICRTILRKPISRYVSGLLAGIPLVDWIFLIPFSLWTLSMATPRFPQHPLELVSLALPPLAFISALLLQRLAPAT